MDALLFRLREDSWTLSLLNSGRRVGRVGENIVNSRNEWAVFNKAGLSRNSVLVDKVVNLRGIKLNIQSTDAGAELNNRKLDQFK